MVNTGLLRSASPTSLLLESFKVQGLLSGRRKNRAEKKEEELTGLFGNSCENGPRRPKKVVTWVFSYFGEYDIEELTCFGND